MNVCLDGQKYSLVSGRLQDSCEKINLIGCSPAVKLPTIPFQLESSYECPPCSFPDCAIRGSDREGYDPRGEIALPEVSEGFDPPLEAF